VSATGVDGPFGTEAEVLALPRVREALDAIGRSHHRRGLTAEEHNYRLLWDALTAAGVELGAYDDRIAGWLAGWETTTCAVIATWVARAHAAGGES
jgi:hypothetical protein